nr:MAG TPA: hypothetical protein [Caudoviricetes sp.]
MHGFLISKHSVDIRIYYVYTGLTMLLSIQTEGNGYIDEINSDCIRFSRTRQCCFGALLMSCT